MRVLAGSSPIPVGPKRYPGQGPTRYFQAIFSVLGLNATGIFLIRYITNVPQILNLLGNAPKDAYSPAILIIGWNRPDLFKRVLLASLEVAPQRVYVSLDGPKTPDDLSRIKSIISILKLSVPADHLVLRSLGENVGLKRHCISAIDWFFQHVDEGVILEDDVVPSPGFFRFCEENLDRWRDDRAISQISGSNHMAGFGSYESSYYFSRHQHIWGWATWRRSWEGFSEFAFSQSEKTLRQTVSEIPDTPSGFRESRLKKILEEARSGHSWDFSWNVFCDSRRMLAVTPAVPLVSNLGFGSGATHAKKIPLIAGPPPLAGDLSFPLVHPSEVSTWEGADEFVARTQWRVMNPLLLVLLAILEKARRILLATRIIFSANAPSLLETPTVAQTYFGRRIKKRHSAISSA